MAIQQQSQGQLQEFLGILKKRYWQVLLPACFALAIGISWAEFLPETYSVTTRVEVRGSAPGVEGSASQLSMDVGNARMHILAVKRVRRVVEEMQWEEYATLTDKKERAAFVDGVISNIGVQVAGGKLEGSSSFVTLSYTDSDPTRAEQFCNRLRDVYLSEVVNRLQSDAKLTLDKLGATETAAKQEYLRVEGELNELVKKHNLAYGARTDRFGNNPGGHLEESIERKQGERLDKEGELAVQQARLATLERRLETEDIEIRVDQSIQGTAFDDQIEDLYGRIALARAAQIGLKPAHSHWRKAQTEIEGLQEQIRLLSDQASPDQLEFQYRPNPARAKIEDEIGTAQALILDIEQSIEFLDAQIQTLTIERTELVTAQGRRRELDTELNAKIAAYEQATAQVSKQRDRVARLSSAQFRPFEILDDAEAPANPTSTSPMVVRLLGLALGLGLGIGLALLAEYGRQSFRNAGDIGRSLPLPVLGSISSIVTRGEIRRLAVQRFVVGLSSFLIIAGILWVTFSYKNDSKQLSTDFRAAIESIGSRFR